VKKLSIRDMRQSLGDLDRILEQEGEITITRRGRPIARVIGISAARRMPSHRRLREKMARVGAPSAELVRRERDER
jgi:prevent-host-death family protein